MTNINNLLNTNNLNDIYKKPPIIKSKNFDMKKLL